MGIHVGEALIFKNIILKVMKRGELRNHFKEVCWKLMKAKQAQENE